MDVVFVGVKKVLLMVEGKVSVEKLFVMVEYLLVLG